MFNAKDGVSLVHCILLGSFFIVIGDALRSSVNGTVWLHINVGS